MNECTSDSPVSAIYALPVRSLQLDDEDLWWFDPNRRTWPRPAIPAQARPKLDFRYMANTSADRLRVAAFVLRCDPQALRTRFFLTGSMDRNEMLERFCGYLLTGPPDGVALLACYGQEPVGLLNFIPTGPKVGEAGLLVPSAWQRRGIGRALVEELRRDARWSGWTLRAVMQCDNAAVHGLVRSLPGPRRTISIEWGCIEMDLQPFEPRAPAD